jgi:hypothetical protein
LHGGWRLRHRKIPGSSFMPDEVFALGDKSKFEGR